MRFLRSNPLFSCLYFLAVLVTLLVVYKLGFKEAAHQIADKPERLRDITFYIWDNYAPSRHGYLVFYSLSDFDKNIAYSNHSTTYLFYMYLLYKIETLIPAFQMRVMGALLNMLSLAGVVFYIIANLAEKRLSLAQSFLCLLSTVLMVSMPGFWISAARFNVDNPFPLVFSMLILTSFFVWRDKGSGKRVWISVPLFAIFSPISAVILGGAMLLYAFQRDGMDMKLFKLAAAAVLTGCGVYLQPPIVSKVLGFASSNGGWMFRSGLDGNTAYFSNVFEAVVSPFYPRPLHIISIPIFLLLAQAVYLRVCTWMVKLGRSNCETTPILSNADFFYFLIFSQYILTCLLWPQAISIHPYLYDYLILAPVSALIIFSFLNFSEHHSHWRLWVLVLMFVISFNFQQIAQAKCDGCSYPTWGLKQIK